MGSRIPFTRLRVMLFKRALINFWSEDPIKGTTWSLHIIPSKSFWRWGSKKRSNSTSRMFDYGFGPIFRFISFG